MAEQMTIARPYARALFDEAVSTGQLEHWAVLLRCLAMTVQDARVQSLLTDPRIDNTLWVNFFYDIARAVAPDAVSAVGQKLENYITLLCEAHRFDVLPQIQTHYQHYLAQRESTVQVTVTSAYALSQAQQADLKAALARRFDSNVSIAYSEDPALIGGALIRSQDWVMDGSIKGRIARLRDALCN